MAKKEKDKPVLNLDDKEYIIEDMTDEQKMMVNHINDLQNKQNTNQFWLTSYPLEKKRSLICYVHLLNLKKQKRLKQKHENK